MMKKNCKKWAVSLAAAVFASMSLSGCVVQPQVETEPLADCFSEEELLNVSKENIELAESGDYEAFLEKLDPSAREGMTESVYQQYLDTVESNPTFHDYVDSVVMGQTDEETGENYAGVGLTAEYEQGQLQYILGYTEDMELLQFVIQPVEQG